MNSYKEPKMLDEIKMTRYRMAEAPLIHQARCVAQHYLSLTGIANKLLSGVKLIDAIDGEPSEETSSYIECMMGIIQKHHMTDFGIALEWSKEEGT